MEHFGTPYYYYYCAFSLLLALLVHVVARGKKPGPRLPPGPWQLPVIGSLHHLLRGLPHSTMRDLSLRHGPLMLVRVCEREIVVASSAGAAREILHDAAAFEQRPSSPGIDELYSRKGMGIVFAPYGDHWRLLRRVLVAELLSAQRVGAFRRVREEEAARLVSSLAAASSPPGQPIDVGERLGEFVADSAVRAIFGDRLPDRAAFLKMMEQALDFSSIFDLRDLFPSSRLVRMLPRSRKAEHNRREAVRLLHNVLRHHEERRAAGGGGGGEQDMIDVLLRIQKDGAMGVSLTHGVLVAVLVDVFVAAIEATATTLQWAMAELMANPRAMKKAQSEIRHVLAEQGRVHEAALGDVVYLGAVIKETLRLHPPIPLAPRVCLDVCKVQGYDVPKGTPVILNLWAISRDPRYWEDRPEKFVPERFEGEHTSNFFRSDFEFIPFGEGRRICPGITFSQANIEIALANLLYHFDWELPVGVKPDDIDMADFFGVSVRRKARLPLHPIPRIRPVDEYYL
ncbi:hypothetical protein C2845_PM17G12200 [Panicum miliaceum]|uniref:Uncharacterized protein n=1 Tax=Panicum miliaceum TaxID=4540 RepID=A0A3L6Q3C6_PANMI|nr:hypothetical protein C2845_PM17G12200 [Panicum miliaceum]